MFWEAQLYRVLHSMAEEGRQISLMRAADEVLLAAWRRLQASGVIEERGFARLCGGSLKVARWWLA